MTSDEKKKQVEQILNNLKGIIDHGIDIKVDGDLFPYELISLALTTAMEMAIFTASSKLDINQPIDKMSLIASVNEVMVNTKHDSIFSISKEDVEKYAKVVKEESKPKNDVIPFIHNGTKYDN